MPLELGLDLGCRRYGTGRLRDKRLLVMDKSRHRYQRFLSDIAGQDIESHANSRKQLIRCIRDWLSTETGASTIPGGPYIYSRFLVFQKELPALCATFRLSPEELTFGDLSRLIQVWLEESDA